MTNDEFLEVYTEIVAALKDDPRSFMFAIAPPKGKKGIGVIQTRMRPGTASVAYSANTSIRSLFQIGMAVKSTNHFYLHGGERLFHDAD